MDILRVSHAGINSVDLLVPHMRIKTQFQTNWNVSQAAPFTKMFTIIYVSILNLQTETKGSTT